MFGEGKLLIFGYRLNVEVEGNKGRDGRITGDTADLVPEANSSLSCRRVARVSSRSSSLGSPSAFPSPLPSFPFCSFSSVVLLFFFFETRNPLDSE